MATTTSIVAGMACLELLKLSQEMYARQRYKNSWINLALAEFKFENPIEVPDLMVPFLKEHYVFKVKNNCIQNLPETAAVERSTVSTLFTLQERS